MESETAIAVWGLSVADLTALLMMGLTFITTVANILLWISTRQTVQLLLGQVQHQVATGYSEAQRMIVDAHRELFFGILNNPPLLKKFTEANSLDPTEWELQKLSAFLVNQVMIGFLNFRNGIISPNHFEGFKRDAQDVFAYQTVRSHWQKVRLAHAEEFRQFVDTELLWCQEGKT
jgi:hypothetical protein